MNIISKIIRKVIKLFRREVLRDPFLQAVKRWFRDDGDNTLRLDYPLNSDSVVWDLGGYHGDFAAQINLRFSSRVFIFEPMPRFHEQCVVRFAGNEKIQCLKFGLSDKAGWFEISDSADASSFVKGNGAGHNAELRPVTEMFDELGVNCVDLLKINIEGGEFEVLPALIDAGLIDRVRYIQVQFHNFVPGASAKRDVIRTALATTHVEMWNYPFVWESWVLKSEASLGIR
jgi:FkbM family methyltransferase